MLITLCKSKIHRATITDADLNYVGSISIDKDLIEAANLVPYEKVQIANISNGERLETYVIEAPAGSGTIALNGAAARKGSKDDLIIIIAYGHFDASEAKGFEPKVVHVDSENKQINR